MKTKRNCITAKAVVVPAKLGAGVLEHILERLPKGKKDENLLVGYDSKDDAAVYRLNERQAVVQTLDFSTDGRGSVHIWKNSGNECPERHLCHGRRSKDSTEYCMLSGVHGSEYSRENLNRAALKKVQEAGGSLAGGHSIADSDIKYGLSVTGVVDPEKIWEKTTAQNRDDCLILNETTGCRHSMCRKSCQPGTGRSDGAGD